MIKFDELKTALSKYCTIENSELEYGFNRLLNITTPIGETFKIEWWANIGYFQISERGFICFDNLRVQNTWPMSGGNLNSIQLMWRGDVIAVLPIEPTNA